MQRTNFTYDPIRQGFDTNLWKTIFGVPSIAAGDRLSVQNAAIVHYADVTKGEFTFNLNVPDSPGGNDGRVIGLYKPNSGAYIVFSIGNIFTGDVSDGEGHTATTGSIVWDATNWNGNNINFKIRWEAGTAKFFVNGTQVGCITDVAVPGGPLSLYLSDISGSAMTVGDITAQGVQQYNLNAKSADTTVYGGFLLMSQTVTITENLTMKIPTLKIPYGDGIATNFDLVTVSENLAIARNYNVSPSETVTITENTNFVIS